MSVAQATPVPSQPSPFDFDVVSSGVDWLTCTATGKDARKPFEAQGEAILCEEAGAGVEVTSARFRDYVGWRAKGVFTGQRRDDSIIVLSSTHAARLWHTVAPLASNVSRIDLQVTCWTHGEQPALSRWYYQRAKRLPPKRGRPRTLSLIQTHPQGDTLYVGKRQSDCFGRCYDFASAHKQGPPRTLWRFEVEFKRHLASHHSDALLNASSHRSLAERSVASWYEQRGFQPVWSAPPFPESQVALEKETDRDVLAWFDTSVSKTVARAIKRHGMATVLDALHLSRLVIPCPRKEDSTYATDSTSALHGENRGRATRPVDRDPLLDSFRHSLTSINSSSRDDEH